ncbi:MAG: hypothetical protein WAV92_09440 [Halopseudomonas yangmingensis]
MAEQLLLFMPGLLLGTLLAGLLGALGVMLRVREEALAAFSLAQVAVLGGMLAALAGVPQLLGAWSSAVLLALLAVWWLKPLGLSGPSQHLWILLLAWGAGLLLADNHPQARLLSSSAIEGQLLLLSWERLPAYLLLALLSAALLALLLRRWLATQLLPWRHSTPSVLLAGLRELAVVGLLAVGALSMGIFVTLALVVIPAWLVWSRAASLGSALWLSALYALLMHLLAFSLALWLDQVYSALLVVLLGVSAVALALCWQISRRAAG